jgi:acyl-CoA thioester hydrolase
MIEHDFLVRVRYSDTDVMGYLHHSNYARYYETARWELFRELGFPYKYMEDAGYMLPVILMKFKFVKPATYDELLTINTTLKSVLGSRITFVYKMFNEKKELINKAEVNLAIIDKQSRSVCNMPPFLFEALSSDAPNKLFPPTPISI